MPPPPPPPPIAQAIVLESASAAANPIAMSFIAVPPDHFRAVKNGPTWLYVPDREHFMPAPRREVQARGKIS
jgi:hypothetical protein